MLNFLDKNLRTIIEQNHLLRCMVQEVLSEIKTLKGEMKEHTAPPTNKTSLFNRYPDLEFPLNSEDGLKAFHEVLKNGEIFNEWVGVSQIYLLLMPYYFIIF